MKNGDVPAIIVAGGKGVRMKKSVRKQYLNLGGIPILGHTLRVFNACDTITDIVLVAPEYDFDYCQDTILAPLKTKKPVALVRGGKTRQESVYNGLAALENKKCVVVIHDGVRPFVTPSQIAACISGAEAYGACLLGMPVGDTLKRVSPSGIVQETVLRDNMWQAQTPQAFQYALIRSAHDRAAKEGFTGTDDASLVERYGGDVKIIKGSAGNIKITHPEDLAIAEVLLASHL